MAQEERKKGLLDSLLEYSRADIYPMHMPGHKRRNEYLPDALPFSFDITEIDGFDDLHHPQGILRQGMEEAAELYGSRASFYLVNGSTCGILAGIRACVGNGDTVLMARNCHKSVYHAVELNQLRPVYLQPPTDVEFGISGSIFPGQVEQALKETPQIRLVIVTSPTYEVIVSDIASIVQIAHQRGIPVLVDEAHGAHLGFDDNFPQSSVQAGADLVVHSLHKTLPSLTQTALLHFSGTLVKNEELMRQLSIFETSSPSYPLMASMDSCIRLLKREKQQLFSHYCARLGRFDDIACRLQKWKLLGYGRDKNKRHPAFFARDPGKLLISVRETAATGKELMARLRKEYGIELEMAAEDYAIAMTSLCDSPQGLERLACALLELEREYSKKEWKNEEEEVPLPFQVMPPFQAFSSKGSLLPLEKSGGSVSREYVWAYPPGVPILVPGERIEASFFKKAEKMRQSGVELRSTLGRLPGLIEVVRQPEKENG